MANTGQNTSQIRVAGVGHLYVAPVGTAAPTDVVTSWSTLSTAWQDLGLTDDTGVVLGKKDSWDAINLWQITVPGRYVPKSREFSAKYCSRRSCDVVSGWSLTGHDAGCVG